MTYEDATSPPCAICEMRASLTPLPAAMSFCAPAKLPAGLG
jgi:hypothetical protein